MIELLKTSITGINIIPTAFLGLVVLYWLTVIIGAIDVDFFDFDLDAVDGDSVSSPFQGILAFLNFGDLPFMLVFSIWILVFWTLSMLMHLLPFKTGGLIIGILLIPAFIISGFISKAVTNPLKSLFKDIYKSDKENEIEGTLCTLLCDLPVGRLGQAEIKKDTASIIINVKVEECENLHKGDKALVIRKDADKNFYIINKFEGV